MLAFYDVVNDLDEMFAATLQINWNAAYEQKLIDYLMQYAKS